MPEEQSKEVELRGRKFRVDVLSARDGSWVLNEALSKKLPLGIDTILPGLGADRPQMTEAAFHTVQDLLLSSVCELIDVNGTVVPKKIFVNGKFTIPSLEDDLFIIARLTSVALLTSLLPFFLDPDSPAPPPEI